MSKRTGSQPGLGSSISSLTAQLRRPSPARVQTNMPSQPSGAAPISASSVASNSQQGSPILSPGAAVLTTNSSLQASPDALRPKDVYQFPALFQLPESILSPTVSANSQGNSWAGTNSPLAEALNGNAATVSGVAPAPGKGNLIRRLSSRASRRITSRRRQSSTTPASRDGSVGPCFLRRRSESNGGAGPEYVGAPIATDSESDIEDKDDLGSLRSMFFLDGMPRESPVGSSAGSANGGPNTMASPVIPLQLQQGTWLRKISKKNNSKRICLVYDRETNKLMWDRMRPNKFLHVDDIREIRSGSDIQQYGRDFKIPESERSKWFSILYSMPDKSKSKFMHLIADDAQTSLTWITFLDAMMKHRQDVMTSLMAFDTKAIAQYWQSEMAKQRGEQPRTNTSEELDVAGVMRVCQNLHIYSSQATLQANFRLADARRCDRLNFSEFLDFVRFMKRRQDVQQLIRQVAAKPDVGLTQQEFLAFLRDVQGEDVDTNLASWEKLFTKLIRKHKPEDSVEPIEGIMSESAFVGFLSSRHNMPLVEEPKQYTLDRPMNEYFISSSHNTYLLGRQVAGRSSIEGYINALVRGCRCVEVDCWDGPDGLPQVVHGRTMTTSISFKEVMTTINKYAFVRSSFPLWISLEVHCNPTQQAIMAETIKQAFGARLVTEPLDPTSDKLPSPSELMERILIKVKEPRMRDDTSGSEAMTPIRRGRRGRGNSAASSTVSLAEATLPAISQSLPQSPMLSSTSYSRRVMGKRVNTISESQTPEILSSSPSDTESGSDIASASRSANKTAPVLGKLGVYCAGVKFPGFDAPAAKKFNHIFSFMESSFAKHSRTKDEKMALDLHNMRYLMRVYPDGTRLASSNFDPLIYWRRGVQMSALNWQTFDLGMQLNRAMFDGSRDASGYVLKPSELRDIQVRPFDLAIAEGKKERHVVSFSVDVLSAQQLMRPVGLGASKSMDFYVEIEVFHANDKRDKKGAPISLNHEPDSLLRVQTDVVRENGFNPLFSKGKFDFKITTKHPELVFVRWTVKLSNDGESYNNKERATMASYTAKLCNLKQGFRTLPLLNHAGEQYLFSTLFCKISKNETRKILVDATLPPQEPGKLNRLGGKVFGRPNTSPRSTVEKGSSVEKTVHDVRR